MKKLEEYTKEELVALYKRIPVYATTWWFKYYRMYKMKPCEKEEPFILSTLDIEGYISSADDNSFFNGLAIRNAKSKIEKLRQDNGENLNEIRKLECKVMALEAENECLYWFRGGHERHVQDYEQNLRVSDPEEKIAELHMNDGIDEAYGRATNLQMYEYIWNTLQYLNVKQLDKLLKFADKGIENKWNMDFTNPGRRSRNCEIRQIDIETGNVVQVYQSRNELIQKTGIKKSHLSQCIKTSKDRPYDREGWKKWIGKDERKYGFVEILK